MGKKQKFFWHVPPDTWSAAGPAVGIGVGNVGPDIVSELISTETVQSARPDVDNFVVERIVGQWMLTGTESPTADRFLHHRIYVADHDALAISLRTLSTADDAETSFLYHRVEPWSAAFVGDPWGTWQARSNGNDPTHQSMMGRHGHLDVRVGRRLEGGQALVWHTQIVNSPPADNVFRFRAWFRLLVRQG